MFNSLEVAGAQSYGSSPVLFGLTFLLEGKEGSGKIRNRFNMTDSLVLNIQKRCRHLLSV